MNKRQRKKVARINNHWYKDKVIDDYECPYCSWNALSDEELKYHKIINQDNDYWGKTDWEFEVKCPHCGTEFEYWDSNM